MNLNQASFSTKARTWVLLAGLTALFIGVGWAIGGAALWFFVFFSVAMNLAAYFWSDKFAIKAAARAGGLRVGGARPAPHGRRARAALRRPEAARLHDPVRAAERVRDRAQPRARGRRGHAGAAPVPPARPGARRARARVLAHQEPRHPRLVDRGDDRRRDLGDREHLLLHELLRRRRRRQPARRDRRPARRS